MTKKPNRFAKARSWKKIQAMRRQAELWRMIWKTQPEKMRANLEKINIESKTKARERTERIRQILGPVPKVVPSLELRPTLAKALEASGYAAGPKDVEKLLSNLRRRGMATFDLVSLAWQIKT